MCQKNILVILVYLCSRPAQGGGAGLERYYLQNKTVPEPLLPILLRVIRSECLFPYTVNTSLAPAEPAFHDLSHFVACGKILTRTFTGYSWF